MDFQLIIVIIICILAFGWVGWKFYRTIKTKGKNVCDGCALKDSCQKNINECEKNRQPDCCETK